MPNKSTRTKAVAFRLPNEIYAIVERRAKRKKLRLGEYLRRKTVYEATRPH